MTEDCSASKFTGFLCLGMIRKRGNAFSSLCQLSRLALASQRVTFTTAKDVALTYAVSVDGLSGTFAIWTAPAEPVPAKPINWWLVGSIFCWFHSYCRNYYTGSQASKSVTYSTIERKGAGSNLGRSAEYYPAESGSQTIIKLMK